MKKNILYIILCFAISSQSIKAQKLNFNETIKKEFTIPTDGLLKVYNISGFVKVEGYNGSEIVMGIDKTISADNQSILEEGKQDFTLNFEENDGIIEVYISEPHDSRPQTNYNRWNNQKEIKYEYNLDFTIKVPKSISLEISTINNGDVTINNVYGSLKANNINGAITLNNIKNIDKVHTINGDVDVSFASLPTDESDYYTLSGDIRINYPSNLQAKCDFKSFQGDLFTDFPNVNLLPAEIVKSEKNEGDKTKYKLNKTSTFTIGNGGLLQHFETFNGNIYLKSI